MSEFIEVLPAIELEDGAMRSVRVDDHELLVVRAGDAYYVTDARCPHLHGDLSKGTLEGTIVTCPRHGSQFDVTDGSVVRWTKWTGAVQTMVEIARHPRPLRTYEVVVEDGKLLVGPQKEPPQA